ncbi:hypothetical protein [Rhizobium ruizarguesonis]|uniref:hypothetical protein n=1 Tax=Rhizobium ruizarguesonis TaxID=2081791 RepID=UPI0013BEE008|nr:hypothetical protein [Rhizobium ruizarguesonis]NEJ02565.1 hypothetical protein [Rhizobium ruizarguesonis]NEJ39693.1 hypothetical protein [Rhizobium ruizarguesonis]
MPDCMSGSAPLHLNSDNEFDVPEGGMTGFDRCVLAPPDVNTWHGGNFTSDAVSMVTIASWKPP